MCCELKRKVFNTPLSFLMRRCYKKLEPFDITDRQTSKSDVHLLEKQKNFTFMYCYFVNTFIKHIFVNYFETINLYLVWKTKKRIK